MVLGSSKAFEQIENNVGWTILWYRAVAKDLAKLKTISGVDHFVAPGGSKAFGQIENKM